MIKTFKNIQDYVYSPFRTQKKLLISVFNESKTFSRYLVIWLKINIGTGNKMAPPSPGQGKVNIAAFSYGAWWIKTWTLLVETKFLSMLYR